MDMEVGFVEEQIIAPFLQKGDEFRGPKGDKGDSVPIAQTTGDSQEAVMSQKATTDAINEKSLPPIVNSTNRGEEIYLPDSLNKRLIDFKVYGKTENSSCVSQGTEISLCGKNLCGLIVRGVRVLDSGGLSRSATETYNTTEHLIPVSPEATYVFSYNKLYNSFLQFVLYFSKGQYVGASNTLGGLTTITDTSSRGEYKILIPQGVDSICLDIYGDGVPVGADNLAGKDYQLERGNSATDYQPYEEPQKITVPTDLYQGDAWQPLIGKVTKSGGVEQYAPYPNLYACSPVCYVFNSNAIRLQAAMQMEYVADTKKYIDNKIYILNEKITQLQSSLAGHI